MPRVTRRSIAAKEEPAPEESPRPTSRGRRSAAKKLEPKAEEVAVGEPQDDTPKRVSRQAKAKEPQTKAPAARGKATPKGKTRGRRGKDVEEKEEEEEEKEEEQVEEEQEMEKVEEAKSQGRGGRARGRGRETSTVKNEASTSRSSSRATRGRATKEEEVVEAGEKSIDEEKSAEESPTPATGRGGRSRGKAKVEATPSPRAGRSSRRGRGAAVEKEEEEEMEAESEDTKKAPEEAEKLPTSSEAKAETKAEEEEAEAKKESQQTESKGETPVPPKVEEEVTSQEEPMDTVESAADAPSPSKKTESPQAKAPTPSKKRKLDEEDEEVTAKRPKTTEAEPADMKDLTDYVVINKEDVPAADSKEVLECVPKELEPSTPAMEAETSDSATIVPPTKDGEPVIVPLTEAELAKQYTQIHVDRDEASSTLVEVGSEGATDTTAMSVRSLDVSDAVSMDSTSTVDDSAINPLGQSAAVPRAQTPGAGDTPAVPTSESIAPQPPVSQEEVKSSPVQQEVKCSPMEEEVTSSSSQQEAKSSPVKEVKSSPALQEVKSSPVKEASSSSTQQEVNSSPVKEAISSPAQQEVKPSPVKEATSSPAQQEVKTTPVQENNVQHEHQQVNDTKQAQSQLPSAPPTVVEAASLPTKPIPIAASTPAPATDPSSNNQIARNGTDEPPLQKNITQNAISNSPVKHPSATPANYVPSSTAIDKRKFILNPAFPLELMDPAFCFSVVSYNILAECHMKRQDYSYTSAEFLKLDYRHSLLLKELDYLEGDIVCMQEVEPQYYKDTLLPAMTSRGYSGWYIKRTQDYFDEGEATFVKNSKFTVKSTEGISLKELAYKEIDDSGLSADVSSAVKQYLDRADVLMLTQLECLKTGKTLTVANIHVVYSPSAPDVQCIQIACAIKQLVSKAGNDLNPHIICGDFNSKVTMAGYQLAKDGYLSDDHIRTLQALEALTNTDGSSRSLIHHLWRAFQHTSSNLKSAYEVAMSKEPLVTSFTKAQHGCLDYVFFSAASLDTVGVLETLDQVVDSTGGLPSVNIPSDHLSLKAVFRMK